MALARYLVEAVVLEGRSITELARSHEVSRFWIYKLLARYREGGYPALEPRSRRPRSCPHQTAPEVEAEIVRLRQELTKAGFDAGPQTILHHLRGRVPKLPSPATIWRLLKRRGLIVPQPHKRPRCSFVRFEADLPNQMWQCDATSWLLADGSSVEILNLLDDHSRLLLASTAYRTVKALDVVEAFFLAADTHGLPASLLTDNAAVFSGGSRRGRVALELELESRGIEVKHSTPYHPQTCGNSPSPGPGCVRRDQIDSHGSVTLRYLGRLRHIRVGARHRHRKVHLLVAGADVRIVTTDGLLLRALTLDPARDYQPLGTGRWPVHDVLRQASTMP